jgi:hypothetical protein
MIADPGLLGVVWAVILGLDLVEQVVDDNGRDARDDPATARDAYVRGDIDEIELERRLELALDPRAEKIRETVEAVDGIGPATSASIAMHFEDIDDLRDAGHEDLEAIHGVGPKTSRAVQETI